MSVITEEYNCVQNRGNWQRPERLLRNILDVSFVCFLAEKNCGIIMTPNKTSHSVLHCDLFTSI